MKDIKTKSEKDLSKTLIEKRESLRNFRFGVSGSKIRNMKEGRGLKREIAQILTEISRRNKELAIK
ncbi:MAG: 50S ribosomal protein L29 [Candidatus Zambryskibacteria bacterium CG_4_9_14_3_um_filter_40_16]|uniref:Large ribosomal subunit protein uL29 n=2 Tax=Candidatus Zambryskiibacteriota TaxID=1817925 RepID=A0A2H0K683_9BACT|nr:MAG: 50S ribosomal protein L29 [Candidatus Zambryskibacteria bacterium CG11_big_fil_rev_8_21_14_0_20_40_24]PJA33738.1 MAG: 50S ribosomal protein L29 [Candidatus Zambryskibacteria bacterium CG_4_9_14_3_um_filter_40_16]